MEASDAELREPSLASTLLLCAVVALGGAHKLLFPSALFALHDDIHLKLSDIALINLAQVAMANLAAPFWGVLADQNTLRRKSILVIGSLGLGVVAVAVAFCNTSQLMTLLLAKASVLAAALQPISDSIIADVTCEKRRGRVIGRTRSAFAFGAFTSAIVTMHLANHDILGLPGWRASFVLLGIVSAFVSLLVGLFLQEPPHLETEGLRPLIEEVADIVKLFRISTFSIIVVEGVFDSIPWSIMAYMGLFFRLCGVGGDWNIALICTIMVAKAGGSILGGYAADALAARMGFRGRPLNAQIIISLSLAIVAVMFFCIPHGQDAFVAYLALQATFGTFVAWAESGTNFPLLSEVAPPGSRSRVMACRSALENLIANSAGPKILVLIARQWFGYEDDFAQDFYGGKSIEAAKALGRAMGVMSTLALLPCLIAYTCLHWSYPRDVRILQEKAAAAAPSQVDLEGGDAGPRHQAYDIALSNSSSSSEELEAGESTSIEESVPRASPSLDSLRTPDPVPARYRGWGMDGRWLHHVIDPEEWCVTKQDLKFFRSAVKNEVRHGRIRRHERDEFDASDDKVGPSMYTVVDQYIKPLTARAGNMSWALLCNPRGLRCDLFITHSWAEGIFEFLDKVLHSWPEGKHNAYICVFANPQNLNLSRMLSVPCNSPFARALDASSHMMVVPNKRCGIYTRAWCAYEAWLAYKAGKIIFTATTRPPFLYRMLECSLLLVSPLALGAYGYRLLSTVWRLTESSVGYTVRISSCGFLFVALTLFSCCQQSSVRSEAKKLRREYTAILHADATDPLDKERILGDIGSDAEALDRSISILLRNGMSTPMLRNLSGRGVTINCALDPNHFPGIGLLFFSILGGLPALPMSVAVGIAWYRADMDERAIVRGLVNKLACIVALTGFAISIGMLAFTFAQHLEVAVVIHMFLSRAAQLSLVAVVGTNVLLSLLLAVVMIGLERIANLAMIGPALARVLRPGAIAACLLPMTCKVC